MSHTHRDLNRGPIVSRIVIGGKRATSAGIPLGFWDGSSGIPVFNPERYNWGALETTGWQFDDRWTYPLNEMADWDPSRMSWKSCGVTSERLHDTSYAVKGG